MRWPWGGAEETHSSREVVLSCGVRTGVSGPVSSQSYPHQLAREMNWTQAPKGRSRNPKMLAQRQTSGAELEGGWAASLHSQHAMRPA